MFVWYFPETDLMVVLFLSFTSTKVSQPDPEALPSVFLPLGSPCHQKQASGDVGYLRIQSSPQILSLLLYCQSGSRCLRRCCWPTAWRSRGEDEIITQVGHRRNSWHAAQDGKTQFPLFSGMPWFFLGWAGNWIWKRWGPELGKANEVALRWPKLNSFLLSKAPMSYSDLS